MPSDRNRRGRESWSSGESTMSESPARRRATVLLLAALLLAPPAARAWGAIGHRIVGQTAEDALSATARQRLQEISGGKSLAMVSTWPDFVRADPAWGFVDTWHYVNVEDGQTLDEILARSASTVEPDNVVEAIGYFTAILDGDVERRRHFQELMSASRATPFDGSLDLTALALLVHFIGDIHQPLHAGRGGDRGGNSVAVNFFGEVKKLHSVWDSAIIEQQELSFTEFTRFLEAEFGGGRIDPGDGGPAVWAQESIDYRHQLYDIWRQTSRENYLPELSWDYVFRHIGTIKRRLYLGGLRLAGVLNEIWE